MTMQTGRNQPCPCGSGKKYKKCCLHKTAIPSQALYYRRLSEAHDRLVDRLFAFADQISGEEAVYIAMHEFLLWPEDDDDISEDVLDRSGPLFWPWFVFNWEYESDENEKGLDLEGSTIAELYAEKHEGQLNTLEKLLIESINRAPYSFWEVLSVDKGKTMILKDILKGDDIQVQERTGSQHVESGDVLFGRVVDVDGVGMMIGCGQTLIPPGRKADIIQLRKQMQHEHATITDDMLYEWDTEIREFYFDIDRALHTLPKMRNTDGHILEFHKLIYKVSSIDTAFRKLCDLCVTMTPEELGVDAKRDKSGRMLKIEIPWDRFGYEKMPGMCNTVLGHIILDGRRLTAEVNSAERAETLRLEIDARLGDDGRFMVDEIQDPDVLMSRHAAGSTKEAMSSEHEELMKHPEVQAQVAELFNRHWESWVDNELPALGGISPKDAVKTTDGREAVEALLKEAERGWGQDPFALELNRKGTQRVREMLGMNDL